MTVPVLVPLLCALTFATPADSVATVDSLRVVVRENRLDVEARRELADLLAASSSIEARREAAEALEEALVLREDDPDLWIRLARLRKRQRFRAESRRAYMRALELVPDRADLWSELARDELLRFQRYDILEYLDDAERANDRTLVLEPDREDALVRRIRIDTMRGRAVAADSAAAALERVDPRHPLPRLLAGVRRTEARDWDRAEREFGAAFARLDSLSRREFTIPRLVDPRAEELSGEAADSVRFVEDFWRWQDPTPADPENPRLLDHYRRMVIADLCFALEDRGVPGWRHAPGEMLVRYGVPEGWTYLSGVRHGEPLRLDAKSPYTASTLELDCGTLRDPMRFTFIDFAMNGVFVTPPGSSLSDDMFLAAVPATYDVPFEDPPRPQEAEVWRFVDRDGEGWVEVAVALDDDAWPAPVLREPERVITRLAVYDSLWTPLDDGVVDWPFCRRDNLGRLVASWRMRGSADSLIVGVETLDLDGKGRAAGFLALPPRAAPGSGPALSDIAFVKEVGFEPGDDSPYRRFYGEALPNPGHRYVPGEAIGIAFAAFDLGVDANGEHHADLRVTLSRAAAGGWIRVLVGRGGSTRENEIVFEESGRGDRLEELLSLAVPTLAEGTYRLEVEVEDRVGGGVARGSSTLEVRKAAPRAP